MKISAASSFDITRIIRPGYLRRLTGGLKNLSNEKTKPVDVLLETTDAFQVTLSDRAVQKILENGNSPQPETKPNDPDVEERGWREKGEGSQKVWEEEEPDQVGSNTRFEPEEGLSRDKKKSGFEGVSDKSLGITLSETEQAQVRHLRTRDREVRSHEQAHRAAGGGFVRGGARYSYQTGPDGRKYAVGGEVSIESSPVSGDPDATVRKAQTIRRAALAPANPSPQDRQVAASASRMENQARAEMARMKEAERAEQTDDQKETEGLLSAESRPSDPRSPTYPDYTVLSGKAASSFDSSKNGSRINTYA